jgi:flagellar hook-associated protein 3 FlgL
VTNAIGAYAAGNGVSGTLGRLVSDSSTIKARLDAITRQASTGLVSQTYGGLDGTAQLSLNLRPQLASVEVLTRNITSAATKIDLSSQVMNQLQQIASTFFSGTVGMASQTSQEVDAMASQASAALSQVQGLLNTKVGDTYLFAGQDSANQPLPDANFNAYVLSIKTAIGGLAAAGGSATAAATLAAASATSPFSATLGSSRQAVTVGFGISASIGVVAGQDTFVTQAGTDTTGSYVRDLIRSLSTIASLNAGQASLGASFTALVDDTRTSLGKQIAVINNENAGLGESRQLLDMNQTALTDTQQALTSQLSSVENVDAAATAVSLSQAQTQLQISYKLISSMQNLSLVHFL